MSTDLVILGGFLGSGKTTLMLDLAERYEKKGLKTAIITNDQGDLLVDTNASLEMGFATKQVSSGCFCCKFSEFMENIDVFLSEIDPDIILAEPVGSCTDLISTLVAPIQNFYAEKIELKGMYILADGHRIIHSYSQLDLVNPGTPEEVLLSHQIKEAGTLLLSKTDLLEDEQIAEAIAFIRSINRHAEIIPYSIEDDKLIEVMSENILKDSLDDVVLKSAELDYEVYAAAEAELGWYNGSWEFITENVFSQSEYLFNLSELFNDKSLGTVSHGKVFLMTKDSSVKLSFVEGKVRSETVQAGNDQCNTCRVVLNIRAKSHPDMIENIVEKNITELAQRYKGENKTYRYKSLIPSPPKPEYRIMK